jgi:hypothetical protein
VIRVYREQTGIDFGELSLRKLFCVSVSVSSAFLCRSEQIEVGVIILFCEYNKCTIQYKINTVRIVSSGVNGPQTSSLSVSAPSKSGWSCTVGIGDRMI